MGSAGSTTAPFSHPALNICPDSSAPILYSKTCWQSTERVPWLMWFFQSGCNGNHVGMEMGLTVFLEKSPRTEEVSHPDLQYWFCASYHHAERYFCDYFSICSILSEEALALLRANCGSRRCTSEIRNPEQTRKAAKRWQQSIIVHKRHQALPWHTKTRVSWVRSCALIPGKGRIQTKQQAGCKEQAWLLPWKSAYQQSCVSRLCMTNTIQHLDSDQTKLINNKLMNNIHNTRGH